MPPHPTLANAAPASSAASRAAGLVVEARGTEGPARLFLPPGVAPAHAAAFWPDSVLLDRPDEGVPILLPLGHPAPPGATVLRFTPGPFHPPRLGTRRIPVALVVAAGPDPVGTALDQRCARPGESLPGLLARIVAGRIGGPDGLPDPGAAALGLPRDALVVLDPCDPAGAAAAQARLAAARQSGLPVVVAQDPFATGAPVLPGSLARCDPWTLLDHAAAVTGASRDLALLAMAAGVAVQDGALAGRDPLACWAALLAATRCIDPFRGAPADAAAAVETLALWKESAAQGVQVAACLGVHPYKQARVRALLAGAAPPPRFFSRAAPALRAARGRTLLVWAASAPADLRERAASAGVDLLWLEDGFLRSAGLGAAFRAGASFALDPHGAYYDPQAGSALQRMLAEVEVPAPLLARARDFQAALRARGLTKYNLGGAAPDIPVLPGRRRILVPGQVEDDASVRAGGGGIRSNLALLQAVRAAEPDAFILYKPHPDIEAGFRRGRIPAALLAGLADRVLERAPMAPLLEQVDAVHTLTSLTGFEALLRGVPVTTWGRPFYAGWGLTTDRAPGTTLRRARTVEEMVAIALILYPRCIDPLTDLPCPPEVLLDRLSRPDLFPVGRRGRIRALQGFVTRLLARVRGVR